MFLFTEKLIKITQFKRILMLKEDEIVLEMKDYKLQIIGENIKITYFYCEEIFISAKLNGVNVLWK